MQEFPLSWRIMGVKIFINDRKIFVMERIDWDTEIMQSFLKEYSKVYNKTLLIVYGYAESTGRDIDKLS